jgi:hypothetical protein
MAWERIPYTLLLLTIVSAAGIVLLFILLRLLRVRELDRYLRHAVSLIFRKPGDIAPDASALE